MEDAHAIKNVELVIQPILVENVSVMVSSDFGCSDAVDVDENICGKDCWIDIDDPWIRHRVDPRRTVPHLMSCEHHPCPTSFATDRCFENESNQCQHDWTTKKDRRKFLEHTPPWTGITVSVKSKEKRKLQPQKEDHLEKLATQGGHVIGIIDQKVLENRTSLWNPMSWLAELSSVEEMQFVSWRDSSCVEWSWTCHLVQDSVA